MKNGAGRRRPERIGDEAPNRADGEGATPDYVMRDFGSSDGSRDGHDGRHRAHNEVADPVSDPGEDPTLRS